MSDDDYAPAPDELRDAWVNDCDVPLSDEEEEHIERMVKYGKRYQELLRKAVKEMGPSGNP